MSCICRPNACVLPFPHLFRTDEIKGGGGEKRHLKPLACKMTATPTNLKLLALLALLGLAAAALPVTPGATVGISTARATATGKPNAHAGDKPAKGSNSSQPQQYNKTAAHLDESSGIKRNGTSTEPVQRPCKPDAHKGNASQPCNESSGGKGKGNSSEPVERAAAGTRQPAAASTGTVLGASSISSNPKPAAGSRPSSSDVLNVRAATTAGRTQPTAASAARTPAAAGPATAGKSQAAPAPRPAQGPARAG